MRSFLMGALALIALEVLVANTGGANAVGGIFSWAGGATRRLISPDVPAIGPVGEARAAVPQVTPLRPGRPSTPSAPTNPVSVPWWATEGVSP